MVRSISQLVVGRHMDEKHYIALRSCVAYLMCLRDATCKVAIRQQLATNRLVFVMARRTSAHTRLELMQDMGLQLEYEAHDAFFTTCRRSHNWIH